MADVDTLPSGSFCWPELSTTDQKAAVTFYRGLFGWDVNDQPIGPTETYSMFQMRGRPVGAAYTMRAEERQHGAPPHWNAYVLVTNVDDSAKRAEQIGGKVVAPPFDVMDAGRMAVVQDPTGATFCLWQAKRHVGIGIRSEPGALCWTELTTSDPTAAEAFYTKLFGWTPKHSAPSAGMAYTEFSVGGQPSIGMMQKPPNMPAHIPSYWMPYFQVANVDDALSKAKTLGAKPMVGPQEIADGGRFAILNDPQGAMFALFQSRR
jgi:uncharacterized protein